MKRIKKRVPKSIKLDLLSCNADAKTVKGLDHGHVTAILYMAPHKLADGVTNMCPYASEGPMGCVEDCLFFEGRARLFKTVNAARIRRTMAYLTDYNAFVSRLAKDMPRFLAYAKKLRLKPCVRLNGTSDQPKLAHALAAMFPQVQFYDYTKIPRPWLRVRPNYHLTFSFSGINLAECLEALKHGINVAVVFQGSLPETWHGFRVINGDLSDLRFLDERGVIVGLKAKGQTAKRPAGGFLQCGVPKVQPLIQLAMAA